MTVGIAAICRSRTAPTVIVSSDRMVTVGDRGGIEFEDTESKIEVLETTEDCSAVSVGAGSSTYIDEILTEYQTLTDTNDLPATVPAVRAYLRKAYENKVRETIQNQIVSPYGYELQDLRDPDVSVPKSLEHRLRDDVQDAVKELNQRAQILLAGVDQSAARIYVVSGNDYDEFTNIGYAVVGSGRDSARLTFIRRRYDRTCGYCEGVFTVLESKGQAEERQGVGSRSDVVAVDANGVDPFSRAERDELESKISDIRDEEQRVREEIMNGWNP